MLVMTRFDMESAHTFAREYQEVFYRGDYPAMASVYAEDARLLAQGIDPLVGREAIEGFWKRAIERAKSVGMWRSIHHDAVDCSDWLGYQRGRVILEIPTAQGQQTITSRWVTVWRREADGVWRMIIDISNTDTPAQSDTPAYGASLKH